MKNLNFVLLLSFSCFGIQSLKINKSSNIDVNTFTSSEHLFVELKELDGFSKDKKIDFIEKLIEKYGDGLITFKNIEQGAENIDRLAQFQIEKGLTHSYAKSIIPVKVQQQKSFNGFYFDVQVNYVKEEIAKLNQPGTSGKIPDKKSTRILEENLETAYLPSTWHLQSRSKTFIGILGLCVRVMIVSLQFFLIVIRPCLSKRNTMLWDSMTSFGSSLLFLQMYLLTSLYSQNFGGALNYYLDQLLLKSNKTFFDALTDKISSFVSATSIEFVGAGYWKLAQNGYISSPILEDWIGTILLSITCLYMAVLPSPKVDYEEVTVRRSLYEMMKEVQTGVTISFMIPLNVSSVNCIYACLSSGIWSLWGTLSFIFSILILAYYTWFALYIRNSISSKESEVRFELNDIYYNHLNFDFQRIYARVGIYYSEYYLFWLFAIFQTLFANFHIFPLLLGVVILFVMLIVFMATPRKTRSEDFQELNKINFLKKIVIGLRLILIGLFLLFMYFIDKIDLGEVRIFTVFCFGILGADLVINIIILVLRIKGLFRTGIRYPYPRMNEDYVELLEGTRNTNMELNLRNGQTAKQSVFLGVRDLETNNRSNRGSYRSNVVSEIPSLVGPQLNQGKRSQHTANQSKNYSKWQDEEWNKHQFRASSQRPGMVESQVISRQGQGTGTYNKSTTPMRNSAVVRQGQF